MCNLGATTKSAYNAAGGARARYIGNRARPCVRTSDNLPRAVRAGAPEREKNHKSCSFTGCSGQRRRCMPTEEISEDLARA